MEKPVLKESALEIQGRVATITFMRDDVRNALTGTALVEDLLDTLAWVNRTSCLEGCWSWRPRSLPNLRGRCG
jgi:hypothetical protein